MSHDLPNHSRGLALAAIGGLALTLDIPLIRLAEGNSWSIVLLRSFSTLLVALLAWWLLRKAGRQPPALLPGRWGVLVAILYGSGSLFFILAVHHTSSANVAFILAFNTAFSALLGWLFLRERPRTATLLAVAAMIVGVLIIVSEGMGSGNIVGDIYACISAFSIAAAIVVSRHSGRDMGFAALMAVVPMGLVALLMVGSVGFSAPAWWWIVLDGAMVIPIAFFCLAAAPRHISGPEVAMFYLLETILAPVWVWMVFAEEPSDMSLLGGAVLVVALVGHSIWQINDGRRRRAALAVRHPA